jgi:chromosome segregation ATPase
VAGESVTSGVWLEEQLQRALERIDALTREVAHTQTALGAREQEVDDLRQALATLDGRTRRQEAAQDALPEMRRTLATIEERLAAESALRRDQVAAAGRDHDRDLGAGRSLERLLIDLDARVADVERALQASADRDAHLGGQVTGLAQGAEQVTARIAALQAQADALTQGARSEHADMERMRETMDAVRMHLDAVEARTETLQRDAQRVDADLEGVRRLLDRETALADVLEQQRVLRLRLEEGLGDLERRMESASVSGRAEAEEHALLRAHLVGFDRTLGELGERVESLRQVLLDHFRRVTISAEEAGRRQTDEIDRQVRAARELLVRLAESADEATREQPQ